MSCAGRSKKVAVIVATLLLAAAPVYAQKLPDGERLKNLTRADLVIGGAVNGHGSDWYSNYWYRKTIWREFNAITVTTYMADGIFPTKDGPIDTRKFKRGVRWGERYDLQVHGHVLCYPEANKSLAWWQEINTRQELVYYLRKHVRTMARAGKDQVWTWDVVNEVMANDGTPMDEDGLNTMYHEYSVIGPDYVDIAFRCAKHYAPDALLILNETGAEEINNKSDRLLAYAKKLRDRGVPIDGIGFQMHVFDKYFEPNYDSIRANLQRFANEGFQLFITELDVTATFLDSPDEPPSDEALTRQKRVYNKITDIAMKQPACKSLFLWEFMDDLSWLHPDWEEKYRFPTPFTGGYLGNTITAKPGYYGIQEAMEGIVESDPPPFVDPSLQYQVISTLDSESGWMKRGGTIEVPDASVRVAPANENNPAQNRRWIFEPTGTLNVYRIRSVLEGESGYLTRYGIPTSSGGYRPGKLLFLSELNEAWSSQQWLVQQTEAGYRIINGWNSEDGILSRLVYDNEDGSQTISRGLRVQALGEIDNQTWSLVPIQ